MGVLLAGVWIADKGSIPSLGVLGRRIGRGWLRGR
jgi:hypothetical protein